LSDFFALILP